LPDLTGALLLLVKMPVVTRWSPYNAFADGPAGINRDTPPIAARRDLGIAGDTGR
jgi:hypothetical protein